MRILINDLPGFRETYLKIFKSHSYDVNELIFVNSFQEAKEFIANYLETQKLPLDLIITNETTYTSADILKANELCFLKNATIASYSHGDFRINSIPTILYSDNDTQIDFTGTFNAIIKKNTAGQHDYFISQCESIIKGWRKLVFDDLENLQLKIASLISFQTSNFYKQFYHRNIAVNAEDYFANKTKVVSLEFIRLPTKLNYDWIMLNTEIIEEAILQYVKTYKNHVKYDRKNNERTILHDFFKKNRLILLRDVYNDMQYETNLYETNSRNSEECDFILKTEYPEFLKTTFFEVKKEDVKLFVKKNAKRPRFGSSFLDHLEQIYGYKEFSENPVNEIELTERIGYSTNKFDYVLLAGRLEEKEEMKEHFDKKLSRMYNGVTVYTYEELEEVDSNYLEKFRRLKV